MDKRVGALLDELRAAGLYDNSIIIFTTDHGDGLPRAKRTVYDSGLKVPLIIRYPDRRGAGSVRRELVSFVDLAPTILSFTGATPPGWMQGRVFAGSKRASAPRYVFAAGGRMDEQPQRLKSVRSKRYRYIRNQAASAPRLPPIAYQNVNPVMQAWRKAQAAGALAPHQAQYFTDVSPTEELYDLHADPDEIKNLASDPRYSAVRRELSVALDQWIASTGDLTAQPERDMALSMWPEARQPVTTAPAACLDASGRVVLASATPGSSIGYSESHLASHRHYLYSAPLRLAGDIEARAIRYGFAESERVPVHVASLPACAA
jgi:arylsulfatase A-like enzyme